MRRLAFATILLAIPTVAHADLPVIDATTLAQLGKMLGLTEEQLQTLRDALQTAREGNQIATAIQGAVSHGTNVNSIASLLGLLRNPLPSTTMIPGAITGGEGALSGNWDGWYQQYQTNNVVYLPQGAQDFQAQQLSKNFSYVTNVQSIATQNMQSLEDRATNLNDLQTQIDSAPDIQAQQALTNRIAIEQAMVQNQQAQATNLQILNNAQKEAMEQAQKQSQRQQIDQTRSSLCTTVQSLQTATTSSACDTGSAGPSP